MKNVLSVVSEILQKRSGELQSKSAEEIAQIVDKELSELGSNFIREEWQETRTNFDCKDNIEHRTCYRVNHGDGTYSETWCGGWICESKG